MRLPTRRSPVHQPIIESDRPTIVFLTLCTARRKRILAADDSYVLILDAWRTADAWLVGRYVVMPDHVHLFSAPASDRHRLASWVHYWRSLVSRQWPRPSEQPIWHPDFWDSQLRHGDSYEDKWEYVRQNPVRHGLVAAPDDWPYAGELNVLRW